MMPKKPRIRALVKFNFDDVPAEYHRKYPFSSEDRFVYLGDIQQMGGHSIVVRLSDGRVFCGYHSENFVELKADEC
jgi:hypothetical protein